METSIRQALINTGSVGSLLGSFVTRPISLVIIILVVGSFVLQARVLKKVAFAPSKNGNGNGNGKEEK